jgi:hypothetical protein
MRNFILAIALFFLCCQGFSQANKPDSSAWGLHFGYDFTRQLGSNINISKIDKSGWEFGGGIGFDFQNNNYSEEFTIDLVDTNSMPLIGISKSEGTSKRLNTSFSIFALKHFPIMSNIDVYLGVIPNIGFTPSFTNTYLSEQVAANYLSRNTLVKKLPFIFQFGANVSLGIRYFFAKRCCFGASMGIGYRASIQNGFAEYEKIIVNSGINNTQSSNSSTITKLNYKSVSNGLYTTNVNLSCSYYLAKK